ncbi:DUF624 domain-containing protein [Microbacterium amylolyticum]|uniref:Uncharacterized protein n=1 Tax=Microbacterium amylolyticum TaxID=936337 RepID=A0ABS4ZLA2_9MICO|nr:hypothetical protein [Microbacterium amylolyticum]
MRIDTDSRTLQGATTFLSFIGLNVLLLLTCLPIITIGAATSALFRVSRSTRREGSTRTGTPARAAGR